jgi:hypothetical protein
MTSHIREICLVISARTTSDRREEGTQMAQAGDTGPRGPELTVAEFLAMGEDERAALIDEAIEEMEAQNRRLRALLKRPRT